MQPIFEKIQELKSIPSYSKHDQLVQGIINAIDEKIITTGSRLPTINEAINELRFARETVVKGYKDLIRRGIVESKGRKGYFVANGNTGQIAKVALLMYLMDSFQEQFYRTFRDELGNKVHIDIFFHHGNIEIFETILNMIKGKYSMYVISPIPHPRTKELLNEIPRARFIMFDRFEPIGGEFSYVCQEFEKASFDAFSALADNIKKFDEMIFFHTKDSLDPVEIIKSYKKFAKKYGINATIKPHYVPGTITKGKVYFSLNNAELWEILNDCKAAKLSPGKDIGILSHNDEPVKKLVADGITTFSTDFGLMGKRAAQAIIKKESVQEIIPSVLIKRKSL
ncbi:GntR family transcriptional regulator [Danxiaibacter flavus]|uniref:GntR family transcriptional regulator n=1 Tax=Danxiaibacter flavus TaxID=3049108 RepID=A0ABV3ZG76_9BACT|nr:GntR family transcriptional regulator [Chitinophagaceae bacterium DXS]